MKKAPLPANSIESNIDLQPSDETRQSDQFDQQTLEKKSTGAAVPSETDTASIRSSDEKTSLSENVNMNSTQNSDQQQPLESEQDYGDIQIDGQQSLDSQCSVTEKWKRLMDGEGYTPSEIQSQFSGQHSSDELLHLFDSGAKSPEKTTLPLNEDSERPFKPLVLLTETTVGVEPSSQPEKVASGNDNVGQLDEPSHRDSDHDVSAAATPPEATVCGGVYGAMASFYEFVDKLFTRPAAVESKGADPQNSTGSQMNTTPRFSKSKTKKKSKKGRKRVTFGEDAPQRLSSETPICERLMFLCY